MVKGRTESKPDFICRCRRAGKQGDFDAVIQIANAAIHHHEQIQKLKNESARSPPPQKSGELYLASVMGYKGYALFQKEQFSEAILCLEASLALSNTKTESKTSTKPSQKLDVSGGEKENKISRRIHERYVTEQTLKQCYHILGKSPPLPAIIKYPRTTHLFDSGGTATTVDDLVLPDLASIIPVFCNGHTSVCIEEKIDGANLGISMCPISGEILVQNRSHYISQGDHAQFNRIPAWIAEHKSSLFEILEGGQRILYGEWVAARHSVPYQLLPGWFVAFDIYDKVEDKFFSRSRFHSTLQGSRIPVVPVIESKVFGPFTKPAKELRDQLVRLLETKSMFRTDGGPVEGIVLRVDGNQNDYHGCTPSLSDDIKDLSSEMYSQDWLQSKFKVVRPDFVRGCSTGHWASRPVDKQRVDFEFADSYLEWCYSFAIPRELNKVT